MELKLANWLPGAVLELNNNLTGPQKGGEHHPPPAKQILPATEYYCPVLN